MFNDLGRKHKIAAVVAGLFVVLFVLEAGLFVLGKVYQYHAYSNHNREKQQAAKTILCLGDSFTFGNGAPDGLDYPSQLQEILTDNGFDVCVINRGIVGGTTTMVIENLERDIDECSPDAIVLLVGGTNEIDLAGLLDFLNKDSWSSNMLSVLGRLHTVRLIRSGLSALRALGRREIFSEEESIEEENTGEESSEEEGIDGERAEDENAADESTGDVREKMPDRQDSLFSQGLEKYHNEQYSAALDVFLRCAFDDYENPLVFDLLFKCLSFQEERVDEALSRLDALAGKMPDPYLLFRNLFLWHFSRGEYAKARRYIGDGLRRSPERKDYYNLALQFFRPGRAGAEKEREALLFEMEQLEAKVAFAGRYVRLAREWMSREKEQKVFVRWISSDMEKILDICRSRNVPVMLQSYPDSYFLYDELCQMAERRGLPFVDQHSMFLAMGFKKRADFFAPDGHCNEKGYAKMARNIFERLQQCGWLGDKK